MNKPQSFEPRLRRFNERGEMTATLADEIVTRLAEGVGQRGGASLVASGGTTPGIVFDTLSQRDAPWGRIFVTPTDERWVPPADDRSNEKLLHTRLLRGRARVAHFVPLMTAHVSPSAAEAEVDRAVARMPRPFDVTLLGMGNDGHTASLFPGAKELDSALDISSPALVRAITPPDPLKMGCRMSLTLRAILDSRWIAILIRGGEKLATYRKALESDDARAMPVRAVIRQSAVPVEVFWSP